MLKSGDIVAVMGFSFPLKGEIIRVDPFSVYLKISKYFKIGFGKIIEISRKSNAFKVEFDDNIRKIVPFTRGQISEQVDNNSLLQWKWKREVFRSIILCA